MHAPHLNPLFAFPTLSRDPTQRSGALDRRCATLIDGSSKELLSLEQIRMDLREVHTSAASVTSLSPGISSAQADSTSELLRFL